MVVTEKDGEILLFEQHEHARVCGELARLWRDDYFIGHKYKDSVIYAIDEHDNGWIELDQYPLVNEETKLPYSFVDYPLTPKLEAYVNGINRIAECDPYAGLICSLHYASFFEHYTNGRGQDFLCQERRRQNKLRQYVSVNFASLKFHYDLLQFCDNLSLYLCMNDPGVNKEEEFSWFRRGFSQVFPYNNHQKIIAHWLDRETVSVTAFPFCREVTVSLDYKTIRRSQLPSLQYQYEHSEVKQRVVTLVKG
ncbi:DUF3891 family protein [Anaerobacillus alkaliphilus]|uniref:DUF3891 family protein n=1 Tax=Anaerobacillus alkaliphilus TaxID=1548597 RepID=UPI0013755E91|nr:DUF3891 family protein [Anaerobacillus alkaliphilus]